MSALNSVAPVSSTSSSSAAASSTSGLNSLSGSDFLNLMINQLEHQDPLNPTDSNQLLTQISQISTLQSNTAMTTSLSNLTLQQSIGAGSNLIGKTVKGINDSGTEVTGVVNSISVQNQSVLLEMSTGDEVPLANVENISPTVTADAAAAASANAATAAAASPLQSIVANNSSSASTLANVLAMLTGK